jgi:LysM repeat protein
MTVMNSRPLRLAIGAAFCLGALAACQSPTSTSASSYASNYPADGFYNPHGGSGDSASLLPSNSYGQKIPPPPPGFEVQEDAPKPAPKKSTASTSSSKPKSTPPAAKKPTSSTASKSNATKSTTTAKAKPKPTPAKKPTSTVRTYAVKQGDTLWGIASKMKSSVERIKAYNGLKSDLVKPGMTIKVPVTQ